MVASRKIQVTLREEDYERLSRIARSKGVKLAAIVRESIQKYQLEPAARRARRRALEALLTIPPVAVPKDYQDWEQEYAAFKAGSKKKKDVR